MQDKIVIRGAREHNLKNISLDLPRNKMIVFTGVSGSGKSSLAFDTIFAEGQRRYVESLSAYARQFLGQMDKPDVDEIEGLSPAISIDQKAHSANPRSTVATITEIYDYLRVLYARVGRPHCPIDDKPIKRLTIDEMVDVMLQKTQEIHDAAGEAVAAPSQKKKGKTTPIKGFTNEIVILSPVVRGRKGEYLQLLQDLYEAGFLEARIDGSWVSLRERIELTRYQQHTIEVVVDRVPLAWPVAGNDALRSRLAEATSTAIDRGEGAMIAILDDASEHLMSSKFSCPEHDFAFPEVEPRLFSFNSPYGACPTCNGLGTKFLFSEELCEACRGARLRTEAMFVYIGGKNIVDLTSMTITAAQEHLVLLELSPTEEKIAAPVLKEIMSRLQFLLDVGLHYLTLNRMAGSLSGGEAQRIRLASQIGSHLVGALYVLDEPTIGLHQRDNDRLIKTLLVLKELGNTIVVVEHDEETIYSSDYLIDIGPGAGVHGGTVVAQGWLDDLLTAKSNESGSVTLSYLRGEKEIALPEVRRTSEKGWIKVRGATLHNLKNQNIDVPLGKLVCITGVSGSGKSTFLYDILHRNIAARFARREAKLEHVSSLTGTEYVGRAVLIDQSPIGRTPRSNPATYTGAFTHIRDLFAATSEARARGWKPGRFSFNVPGGRCEACQGNGSIAVEMHFLPTVYVTCDICMGKRFMKETLEVTYRGKNIHEVLQMTIEEAEQFFHDIPAISDRLQSLNATGLEYLTLGQSATTLSGGEAQRVKIASEMYRQMTMKTIYLLDEPTVGLHYEDVKKLIDILQELVRRGNTVVVIEHNLDVIKSADYLIDFGPEGGIGGGKIVAKGTPEEVADTPGSYTGEYLAKALHRHAKKRST
jgi:excinuclease ABC subunit A